MPGAHIAKLEKDITALSDALARLGQGTSLKELLIIIRRPGFTSVAEAAFLGALLNAAQTHAAAIETLQADILTASNAVGARGEFQAGVQADAAGAERPRAAQQ